MLAARGEVSLVFPHYKDRFHEALIKKQYFDEEARALVRAAETKT